MEHGHEMPEGHLHWSESEYDHGKALVWKTILILSAVTICEVGIAMAYDHFVPSGSGKWMINLLMAVMSVVKVYYIMGIFMHLKDETKGFFWSVAIPFTFLIWAIIAFAYEGVSWHYMRTLLNVF